MSSPLHRAASARRREVIRAAEHQLAAGRALCPGDVLDLLAVAQASAPKGAYWIKGRACRWPGLCPIDLARRAAEAGLGQFGADDPEIRRAIDEAGSGRTIGSEEAGRLLGIDAELRDLLGLRTIEAVDEPRTEREARRREEARLRNADRMRAARKGKHRPRSESLSSTRPWQALGISRSKFYRLKRETELCAQIRNAETDLCVRQVCVGINSKLDARTNLSQAPQAAAPRPSLQRSGPSPGPSLGAGSAVADGAAISAPRMTLALGSRDGLGDGSSPPEALAQKKTMPRPGPTVEIEDPREAMLAAVFPDATDRCAVLEGLGGYFRGLQLAHLLGVERLLRLRDEAQRCGGLWNADGPLEVARQAAIEIERAKAARMVK